MSEIIESLRDDLTALQTIGAISAATLREFEAICPASGQESHADESPGRDLQNEVDPTAVS